MNYSKCQEWRRIVSFFAALLLPLAAMSQSDTALRTTDDTRRVPIPPSDVSTEPEVVIRGGIMLDGSGNASMSDSVIAFRGNRITYAGAAKGFKGGDKDTETVDVQGLYVLPGLIDLHIHFTSQRGNDASRYRDSDAAAAIRGVLLLDQLLDAGVTTVRDAGTRNDVALKIKEAVERRMVAGPRVLWSGQRIVTRGGHGDEIVSVGSGNPKSTALGDRERLATGPWEWRLAVREQIRQHADWIKLTAPATREELAAAIDEAHLHGLPVTIDSFGKFSLWAAEAGVDGIEHPLDLSEETIAAMARNGTDLVPTLTTFWNLMSEGYPSAGIPAGGFYYTMARRFPISNERHLAVVNAAHEAGVRIGIGTDIPIEADERYPESYYSELSLVKDAGLSDSEVLASATRVGAEILRMSDKLGVLREGMLADILVVGSDPREDIQNLRDVRLVVANGRIVRDRRPKR